MKREGGMNYTATSHQGATEGTTERHGKNKSYNSIIKIIIV